MLSEKEVKNVAKREMQQRSDMAEIRWNLECAKSEIKVKLEEDAEKWKGIPNKFEKH